MTANKKLKNNHNNYIVYIIEAFLLTAAAVFFSVGSGLLSVGLLGLLCVAAASALLACVMFITSPVVMFVSGLASFAITMAANRNIISAVSSLIYIIIAALIYFGIRTKKTRTQITVRVAVFLAVFYAGLIVLSFLLETGTFSVNMLSSEIDGALSKASEFIAEQYSSMLEQNSNIGGAITADSFEIYLKEFAVTVKSVIPACFALYNIIIAYLATSVFRLAYNIFIPLANPKRKKINNKYWRINMSVVSAIIISAALFAALLVSTGEDNIVESAVVMNLVYILAPGFCLTGIYFVYDKLKSRAGIVTVALVIGAITLVFIYPTIAIVALYAAAIVLTIIGIYASLKDAAKKFYEKAKKTLLGDDDNNDDDDDDYID